MPKTTEINQPGDGQLPGKPDEPRAASAPEVSTAGVKPARAGTAGGHNIAERKGQFLIAARRPQGLQPMGFQPLQIAMVEQTLRASPDIEVVDTVGPKSIVGMLADGMNDEPTVLVARMTEQKAGMLHQQAQGRLIVERDQSLALQDASDLQPMMVSAAAPNAGPVLNAAIIVVGGKDRTPVKDAEVFLFGSMVPTRGVTDERGMVTLTLYGETPQSIRSLYVKPRSDYWSFYQPQPDIAPDEANIVGLRPLSDWPSLANFPQQQSMGWGQRLMRLDQLPGNYRGQGVRIAIIDSGAATTHDDLRKIQSGFDVVNKKQSPDTWNEDSIAHGSHCAGIICGDDNAYGVRGFAPDAEVHVCKLFPGGQVSQLIDALEYCIEKQVDVVNMSLGGAEYSEALEQQIQRARRAGVACIVAAGNSGGRVQYPGSSPNVLAVAAVGHAAEFPPDSYHTQTLTQMMDGSGLFAARFSCFGPEIGVCAPGVAITSSVPPNNFAAWDGTSMAAPHVTGVAALVLAHHPEFQTTYKTRSPERVERLFQILKMSSRRINLGDPSRTGFGVPDVLVAVGLQTPAGAATGAAVRPVQGVPQAVMQPMMAGPYYEQPQLQPQAWLGMPWGPQQSALSLSALGGFESPYAAWSVYGRPQSGLGVMGGLAPQGMGFGMARSGFGMQGW
ncbi:S8 family peptidase [Noviherbaspirillum aridicola]|uniref:Peptidase S8/S53 domain-containing protein n=1 Tax=Noviherbaspirillum aridicola TaxID=2849687 RepID=A0ABQ4PYX3_9BURK|nr:S8 family serine peptidase [Noviherbaspirillum aridicola]GIZ50053.1 hypothetical protein NCCP691_00670 [Noviherbaspirillum aridicola]